MDLLNVYFIGIGGIGMSALARFFMHEGKRVGGYDRTPSQLTGELQSEGAAIHYDDDPALIPECFLDPAATLVVYTPAVPHDHRELGMFRTRGFEVIKRSQCLGHVTADKFVMATAGTHGKTTTSTLTAWLDRGMTEDGGSAFLGGISKNFDSNLVLGRGDRMVVEADEFDRSFLRLSPDVAAITSADPDHLDIYGTHEAMKEAFAQFVERIKPGGALILKHGTDIALRNSAVTVYSYSTDNAASDFHAANIRLLEGGHYLYDIVTPGGTVTDCTLGVPGRINIENSIAATAQVWCAAKIRGEEFSRDSLRRALASFSGVKRRFDFWLNTPRMVYMDDYAHHPREIGATLASVRAMFPGRRITAVFQPHLYTRTRDLCDDFARALSQADEVLLAPIYPAREEPIEGVCSERIGEKVTVPWSMVERENLAERLAAMRPDVVITFGAGNIDACCRSIASRLQELA